jgi:hypothetical protein
VLEDEPEDLIVSSFQTTYEKDGVTLQILIHRSAYETNWTLEIVDKFGISNVLGVSFKSDQDAYDEAFRVLDQEGVAPFSIKDN